VEEHFISSVPSRSHFVIHDRAAPSSYQDRWSQRSPPLSGQLLYSVLRISQMPQPMKTPIKRERDSMLRARTVHLVLNNTLTHGACTCMSFGLVGLCLGEADWVGGTPAAPETLGSTPHPPPGRPPLDQRSSILLSTGSRKLWEASSPLSLVSRVTTPLTPRASTAQ
jgi:hypothetical protein